MRRAQWRTATYREPLILPRPIRIRRQIAKNRAASRLWYNSVRTHRGERLGGLAEGARDARVRRAITERSDLRKGSGTLTGYPQSSRGAGLGTTGNGLEAGAREQYRNGST